MAENKRNFWTTVPGVISGVAAIVTGLGVLIPIMLGVGSKHANNSASQNNTPGAASSSVSQTVTSTTGTSTTDTTTPSPTDGLGVTDTASPGASPSSGPLAAFTASPSTVSFGSVRAGLSSADTSVVITNPGGAPLTIDHVSLTGSNATWFTISSTNCGDGATISPKGSCQVSVRFSPTSAFVSAAAQLRVDYHPPQSSFVTVDLSGTGSLI